MFTCSFSAFFMWRNFLVSKAMTSSQLSLKSMVEFSSRCVEESGEPWLLWAIGVVGVTLLGRLCTLPGVVFPSLSSSLDDRWIPRV